MENHFYEYVTSIECYYFITHVRNCVMWDKPLDFVAVDSLFVGGSIMCVGSCLVLVLGYNSLCLFLFCNHLAEEKKALIGGLVPDAYL